MSCDVVQNQFSTSQCTWCLISFHCTVCLLNQFIPMISVIYIIMVTSGSGNIWCVVIAHGHVPLCVRKFHTSHKTVSTILRTHGNRWLGIHGNNSYLDMNFFVIFLSVYHYKDISCSDYVTLQCRKIRSWLFGFTEYTILFSVWPFLPSHNFC